MNTLFEINSSFQYPDQVSLFRIWHQVRTSQLLLYPVGVFLNKLTVQCQNSVSLRHVSQYNTQTINSLKGLQLTFYSTVSISAI